ncbi:MAG: Na-K-Cl cotransporter [Candidatus Omnitrophica bacterium CG11_big_fil_rev_8_21_14_0_20_63_9]|nr:MAG: Na-K-Cl cotransporter [Candidatus Omnitrophica bacterium CG11_big_fil_rev_8_21_14_0_20_63_9]
MSLLQSIKRARRAPPAPGYRFGAFKGVYMPSLLTILGVIMYLRFGWVLGNVGLASTLLIVTLATAITFLTGLSLSALATNMRIGGGGAYYIISRSLGLEAGAAIGLPLFLAQACGIAFYIAGFSESVVMLLPWISPKAVGIATLAGLLVLTYFSADIALRAQSIVLALVVISLASFFLGGPPVASEPATAEALAPFWTVFAVFFPAVTGIEAGLAMSGDLKRPGRALPLGTLGAVATSYLVYLAIPVFIARTVSDQHALLTNPLIMMEIARWGPLVLVGLWGAALSSAIGSLLGAPRTLQALARDGVVPRILGRGFGPGGDPRLATVVAFMVGLVGILSGGLNVIAPVLSMFFLTSYGLLNLSAALEGWIGSPSWRPTFRVPWGVSLAGAAACGWAMLMINPGATLTAILVSSGAYALMKQRRMRAYWGDLRYGILRLLARLVLYRLASYRPNERSWRPNILVLSGSPTRRWYLIALADAISHGKGFLTVATVVSDGAISAERVANLQGSIEEYLRRRRVPAMVKVQVADDPLRGAHALVQTYGFGPLVPNTVLLGETQQPAHIADYVRLMLLVSRTRRNLVIVREAGQPPPKGPRPPRIDVWWDRHSQNGGLILALGYLLRTSPEWRRSQLMLKTVARSSADQAEEQKQLERFLEDARLEAGIEVLVAPDRELFESLRSASQGAGFVFMGLRPPKPAETVESYGQYYTALLAQTEGFPPLAMVLAAEALDFQQIFDVEASTGPRPT